MYVRHIIDMIRDECVKEKQGAKVQQKEIKISIYALGLDKTIKGVIGSVDFGKTITDFICHNEIKGLSISIDQSHDTTNITPEKITINLGKLLDMTIIFSKTIKTVCSAMTFIGKTADVFIVLPDGMTCTNNAGCDIFMTSTEAIMSEKKNKKGFVIIFGNSVVNNISYEIQKHISDQSSAGHGVHYY